MNFIEKLKNRIGKRILQKRMRKKTRKVAFSNFKTAKRIGILFDAMRQESYLTARSFITYLRNMDNEVLGIGYVANSEAITYFPYHQGISFFSIKNNNWYLHSKSKAVAEFNASDFDILIDLSIEEHLQLRFIVGESDARLKIGKGDPECPYYDIVLNIKSDKPLAYFIEQLKLYVNVLEQWK